MIKVLSLTLAASWLLFIGLMLAQRTDYIDRLMRKNVQIAVLDARNTALEYKLQCYRQNARKAWYREVIEGR